MEKTIKNHYSPEVIAIDVTYKCNLKCLHCFNSSGESKNYELKELTDDELLDLCDDIIKLMPKAVCLCGGEATLREEVLYKIIKKISEGTNYNTKVNMVTNGQIVTEEIAKKLKEAGLFNVQVSLDGPDSECYDWIRNKDGAFEKATAAIKHFVSAGLYVSVSCCPTKKNYNRMEETINLAKELGVRDFRVQPMMNLGRAQNYLSEYFLSYSEYKELVMTLNRFKNNSLDIKIEWGDPIQHLALISTESTTYIPALSISANGNINISPYIPIYFGNIRNHKLIEYWENGLSSAEKVPFYKELCKKITSTKNMDISKFVKNMPRNYVDKQIGIDLIDNPEYESYSIEDVINLSREIV